MATKKVNKKPNQSSKFTFWVIGLIVVCLIGFIFLSNGKKQEQAQKQVSLSNDISYQNQPSLGNASAPVQIAEFGDYKCPACKAFEKNFFPLIQKGLIDTGKVKFYFMNDSFISIDSIRSAKFAEAVYQELGDDTFWKFHELLYSKQPDDPKYEKMDVFTDQFLEKTLKEIVTKQDVEKVVKAFKAKESEKAWQTDMDLAKKLKVPGTPALYINGKPFEGNTFEDLKNVVDEAAKEK